MKVGDIIQGNEYSFNHYNITNEDCIMRVERVCDHNVIFVRVIYNKREKALGEIFRVDSRHFHRIAVTVV